MARERHHVDEIAHLAAAAVLPAVDRNLQIEQRKFPLQPIYDGYRGIQRITHTEDHLKLRVALIAERTQTLIRFRLGATKGFQYRYRRQAFRGDPRDSDPHAHGDARDDGINHREGRKRESAPQEPWMSGPGHWANPRQGESARSVAFNSTSLISFPFIAAKVRGGPSLQGAAWRYSTFDICTIRQLK